MRKWPLCARRQACWREGGTICCKVEMKLALSETERNLESVPESWREDEEEEEEREKRKRIPLISSSPPTKQGIKETPVV